MIIWNIGWGKDKMGNDCQCCCLWPAFWYIWGKRSDFIKQEKNVIHICEDKWQVNRTDFTGFIQWLIYSKLKLQSRLDHYSDCSQIKPASIISPTSHWGERARSESPIIHSICDSSKGPRGKALYQQSAPPGNNIKLMMQNGVFLLYPRRCQYRMLKNGASNYAF